MAPTLKPAYLVHGDDHGAIAERRANLRGLAEREGGAGSIEVLSGEAGTPEAIAQALAAMTFAIGQRVIIVDGVERFKQVEVERHLAGAMSPMPPETTIALFAREEGRAKAPAALHQAVKAAGGQIIMHATVKPWELPKWVREQAGRLGLRLDMAAAKALVAQVGERQQRLLRELEKLALELGGDVASGEDCADVEAGAGGKNGTAGRAGAVTISAADIEARAARSSQWRAFTLADALVGGDTQTALRTLLALQAQGERLPSLTYVVASRLREAVAVAQRLQDGESAKSVAGTLRMPSRAAQRLVADVARADPDRLRRALGTLADVEVDLRGGAQIKAAHRPAASLAEETVAVLTVCSIAGG